MQVLKSREVGVVGRGTWSWHFSATTGRLFAVMQISMCFGMLSTPPRKRTTTSSKNCFRLLISSCVSQGQSFRCLESGEEEKLASISHREDVFKQLPV